MREKTFVSFSNSKLGEKIPTVNLPAGLTCRADAPCQKGCYAKKGNMARKSVKKPYADNLEIFKANPEKYFNSIVEQINGDVVYRFMRWHSAGDIVNLEYLQGMVRVANQLPDTKFLCFTKKFFLINSYIKAGNKLPENLKIVFSGWDKTFDVINPYNFPVTYVDFKNKQRNADIPEFAIPCVGSCKDCKACWSLKPGQSVYFHEH